MKNEYIYLRYNDMVMVYLRNGFVVVNISIFVNQGIKALKRQPWLKAELQLNASQKANMKEQSKLRVDLKMIRDDLLFAEER